MATTKNPTMSDIDQQQSPVTKFPKLIGVSAMSAPQSALLM
jgi:hypothetical protein